MGKRLFYILLLLALNVVIANNLFSQWQQTFWPGEIVSFGSIGNKLFVNSYAGLLLSNDSGSTWLVTDSGHQTILADSILNAINAFSTINGKFFIGTDYGVYISIDSGGSWAKLIGSPLGVISLFKYKSELFAINYNVEKYIDSGMSWINIYDSECFILDMATVGNILFAGCTNSLGHQVCGVLRSTDDGLSWKEVIPGSYGQTYSYWYVTTIGSIVLATATDKDTAFISYDTGTTWIPLRIPTPPNYGGPDITSFAVAGTNIFAGYTDEVGGVTLSTDTGKTWTEVGSMHLVNSLYIFGDYIFAGTNNTGLYRARLSDFGIDAVKSSLPENEQNFKLLSNPIISSADFQFDALQESTVFELFDALGRSVLRQELPAGQASLHLDMQKYPAGIYIARMGGETVRFIKLKA